MKRITALFLALIMALSSFALIASAEEYNDIPCVIVPGIGQSRAWLVDESGNYVLNGDGEKIHCFPGNFDVKQILSDVAAPLALSVSTQSDAGLSDALCASIEKAFEMNKTYDNGEPCGLVEIETYPHPLSECTEDQKQYIFDCIPMQRMGETIGFENMYYYAYNSFGNALEIIEGLYRFIQTVKQQTGKDKVNIIPISMGGAIFNGLMELHPEVADDFHRIVFVVPALNGSLIVSDIYERELAFLDADYLYSDFFDGILGEANASAIEIAIRVLPKDVLMTCLNKTVDMLLKNVFANCTGIWMLVPNEHYDKCVEMNLSDNSKAEIRRQTDIYHRAQTNSNKNILAFRNKGVEIFNVIGYDVPLYNVGNSWNSQNADGVIHTYSTSMGAKMANCGETLPADYVQANTYCTAATSTTVNTGLVSRIVFNASTTVAQCSDPTHNHISPDRVVDASTGLLPDHTFYFDDQPHATANQNDIIMKLCCELVETDRIKDVFTDENYPQFNVGRATKALREELLPAAAAVDRSALSAHDRRMLDEAVNEANEMLDRTIAEHGEAPRVENKLRTVLENIGAIEPQESTMDKISPTVKTISDALLAAGGAQGYSDMIKGLGTGSSDDSGNNGESSQTNNNEASSGNSGNPSASNSSNGSNASSSSDKSGSQSSTPSSSGSASSKANSSKSPKTGNEATDYTYLYVAAAVALGIIVCFIIKKRRDAEERLIIEIAEMKK